MSVLAFLLLYILWNKYSVGENKRLFKNITLVNSYTLNLSTTALKKKSNQRQTFEQ